MAGTHIHTHTHNFNTGERAVTIYPLKKYPAFHLMIEILGPGNFQSLGASISGLLPLIALAGPFTLYELFGHTRE